MRAALLERFDHLKQMMTEPRVVEADDHEDVAAPIAHQLRQHGRARDARIRAPHGRSGNRGAQLVDLRVGGLVLVETRA